MAPVLLIISIMYIRVFAFLVAACTLSAAISHASAAGESDRASGSAIVREMNLARQNPALYASYIEELRGYFQGNLLVLPGRIPFRTKEGTRALDEAIQFLRSTQPQAPIAFSPGMSRAAADHCADQAGGGMSHKGRDWSSTGDRISRYGTWSGTWGENLSCGRRGARETMIALIVDDGCARGSTGIISSTRASIMPERRSARTRSIAQFAASNLPAGTPRATKSIEPRRWLFVRKIVAARWRERRSSRPTACNEQPAAWAAAAVSSREPLPCCLRREP